MDRITRPAWGTLALLFVLIFGLYHPASASIVYVNKNANGTVHDGNAWSTAFTSVQPAIDATGSGDEVWVAAGTYYEDVVLNSSVSVFGGFAGKETLGSQRNWESNLTTLDGSLGTTVTFRSSGSGAVLDGFCVQHGTNGIAVLVGPATIANCAISGNSVCGIVNYDVAKIENCTFSENRFGLQNEERASIAGCRFSRQYLGVLAGGTSTTVAGCTVSGSTADGIWVNGGAVAIADCSFFGNGGHGVSADYGSPNITNCTIEGNAGGVYIANIGSGTMDNCIVAFNRTGIEKAPNANAPVLLSNDAYGNSDANYAGLSDATGTAGNISIDPRFADRTNGDLHLLPDSPCRDAGDDSAVISGERDRDGQPRVYGSHVDMGAYEWQIPRPWAASLGTGVSGGVTVAEKVAYVSANDGKLYARSTMDGSAVSGFPVDINAAVGTKVRLPSRPAVYYGKTGKAIYLTTDRGDVVRVLPTGQVAWHVRPLTGQTVSTPAVTPDGSVFVNLSTGSGPFNNYVFKLDEATGTPLSLSPFLGYTTADNIGDFSPAANGSYLYVNAGWGSKSGLTLLNQDNLAARSSFAGGEQCLSPLLLGSDLLLASKGGKAWKMNAVTLVPDLGFGHFGVADLGTPISAAPFSDVAGNVYIGTADGKILKWVPGTGSFTPFYTATGKVSGLTINRTAGILGFGTSTGTFVQVPLSDPSSATTVTLSGAISTGTVYESSTDRFIVVTDGGVLSGYPSVR